MSVKTKAVRIIAIILAVLFAAMVIFPIFAADETNDDDGFLDPIPLLVIKISFDPNGNGVNDFDMANGSKLYANKESEVYGEQWCYSTDSHWANILFGANNSMKTFYQQNSGGKFWFYPAEETYANVTNGGIANDGIVNVTVKYKHPYAQTGNQTNEHAESRSAALREADKYVDFASFDKDGNGFLSYNELAIVFVCGGYEYSAGGSSRPSDRLAFSVHAHYTTGSGVKLDGVTAGGAGFVRLGEYISSSSPASIGVIAHELGHFIGAADLYDANGTWNYVGNMSLMASGSWSSSGGDRGNAPAYMDPFNEIECGIAASELITDDGEYTLYSHNSKKGTYNILKITTQNPLEYYLIENRYTSSDTAGIEIMNSQQGGIVIWHIDESVTNSSGLSGINTQSKGHEPGVVVMGVSSLNPQNCAFKFIDGSINGQSYTFTPSASKYRFPISGTSFTTLTSEQAAEFKVVVSVTSYAGHEMKIKVSDIVNIPPTISAGPREKTDTTLAFGGKIINLNGGDITSCEMIISKNSIPTEENGTKVSVTPNLDAGTFEHMFEGLEPNTKYFCRVTITGKYGTAERIVVGYTRAVFKERTDYFVVYMYKNMTAVERSYEVKIKPGSLLSYKFPMEKTGYDFCGWYLDETLTEKYDMGFTQTKCTDFSLYAKWAEEGSTASLTLVGAESKYLMFATEVGDTFTVPTPAERTGYTFVGWYTDETLTDIYDFGQAVENPGEVKVYAKWVVTETTPPETSTETTTTETTSVTSSEGTETTGEIHREKGNTTVVVIAVAAAVIVIAIVAVVILGKKRKDK